MKMLTTSVAAAVALLAFARLAEAQDNDADMADKLLATGITVSAGSLDPAPGQPSLLTGEDLPAKLRTFARNMLDVTYRSASPTINGEVVRWAKMQSATNGDLEIAIATPEWPKELDQSSLATNVMVVTASGLHRNVSAYASGAVSNLWTSAKADALVGRSDATAIGGDNQLHAGGSATSKAARNAFSDGGDGGPFVLHKDNAERAGDGGEAEATTLGERDWAFAIGGMGGSPSIGPSGQQALGGHGGRAVANALSGEATAIGHDGGLSNLGAPGIGAPGGDATATCSGTGQAIALAGDGGHINLGQDGKGGLATATSNRPDGTALAIGGPGGDTTTQGAGGPGGDAVARCDSDGATAIGGNGGNGKGFGGTPGPGGTAVAVTGTAEDGQDGTVN